MEEGDAAALTDVVDTSSSLFVLRSLLCGVLVCLPACTTAGLLRSTAFGNEGETQRRCPNTLVFFIFVFYSLLLHRVAPPGALEPVVSSRNCCRLSFSPSYAVFEKASVCKEGGRGRNVLLIVIYIYILRVRVCVCVGGGRGSLYRDRTWPVSVCRLICARRWFHSTSLRLVAIVCIAGPHPPSLRSPCCVLAGIPSLPSHLPFVSSTCTSPPLFFRSFSFLLPRWRTITAWVTNSLVRTGSLLRASCRLSTHFCCILRCHE